MYIYASKWMVGVLWRVLGINACDNVSVYACVSYDVVPFRTSLGLGPGSLTCSVCVPPLVSGGL
jgi:hypothetical protein